MFGWRRRNDGFEWRQYVRTTILLRRKKRRQRLSEARHAALHGIKDAGRRGAATSVTGAITLWHWLGVALGHLKTLLHATSSHVASIITPTIASGFEAIKPLPGFLRQPRVATPLGIAGGVAAFAALARLAGRGLDVVVVAAALIIGVTLALALLLPDFLARNKLQLPRWLGRAGVLATTRFPILSRRPAGLAGGLVAGALGFVLITGGYSAVQSGASIADIVGIGGASTRTLTGRAVATSGDSLRIAGTFIRLAGIEAPERNQDCRRPGNKRWRCGLSAAQALARLVRGRPVTCHITSNGTKGLVTKGPAQGTCYANGTDLAIPLISRGHVFAESSSQPAYSNLEGKARAASLGLWSGQSERPSAYRAKRWEEARRAAPEGCPIKGQLTAGGRVYVLPWARAYDRVKVRQTKGERWFCSEEEAQAAGWKPLERS